MYYQIKEQNDSVITRKLRALKGPQVRTITRNGTGSVILFNCAESPMETISEGDSVQTGSQGSFLRLFALSYGMTGSMMPWKYKTLEN